MTLRVRSLLSISTLVLTLSSCSLLGDRKESTRLSLEDGDNDFKQIRVIAPNSSGIKDKKNLTDEEKSNTGVKEANLAKGEDISYSTQFIHPTISAEKYVKDNKINFWQISGNKKYMRETGSKSLPKDLDRASYFFGLGGKISGELKIVKDPTDDQKTSMNYDDQKMDEIHAKMTEADPSCSNNIVSLTGAGEVSVKLTETNIDQLVNQTLVSGTTTLRDVLETVDPTTKKSAKVDVIYFKNLDDKKQEQIKGSFDPNLGTLLFPIASQFEICNTSKPQAYILEMGEYNQIKPEDIKISDEDGNKKVEIKLSKIVTSEQIQKFKTSDNQKSLKDLTFGMSNLEGEQANEEPDPETQKKLPVFNEAQQHEQVTQYTFYLTPTNTSKQVKKEVKKEVVNKPTENKNSNEIQPPVENKNENNVQGTLNLTDKNTTPAPNNTTEKVNGQENKDNPNPNEQKNVSAKTNTNDNSGVPELLKRPEVVKKETKKTTPLGISTPPAPGPFAIPPVAVYYPIKKGVPTWFNPRITGHAKQFYTWDDDDVVYSAGEANSANSDFWLDTNYKRDPISDSEVTSRCSGYKYIRTIAFNSNLSVPGNNPKYWTFKNGNNTVSKSYRQVLSDQIHGDVGNGTGTGTAADYLADAAMNLPSGIKSQTWKIKLCFEQNKPYQAFWSSSESKTDFAYSKATHRPKASAVTPQTPDRWFEAYKNVEVFVSNTTVPSGFNPARKKDPHSTFAVICKSPTDCAIQFQVAIKRNLPAPTTMAYMDLSKIGDVGTPWLNTSILTLGRYKNDIVDDLFNRFTIKANGKPKANRIDIFTFGGAKFNPQETGEKTANLVKAQTLVNEGYVKAGDYDYLPTEIGDIIFAGSLSEYYMIASTS